LDPWMIYERAQNGKSLWQIAKELFSPKECPTDIEESDRRYKQVQRAFKKAEKLIKEFEG
jgi:hypothetical protein